MFLRNSRQAASSQTAKKLVKGASASAALWPQEGKSVQEPVDSGEDEYEETDSGSGSLEGLGPQRGQLGSGEPTEASVHMLY